MLAAQSSSLSVQPLSSDKTWFAAGLQMMYGVPEEKVQEAQRYLKAVQDGLKKVQGAIDLK